MYESRRKAREEAIKKKLRWSCLETIKKHNGDVSAIDYEKAEKMALAYADKLKEYRRNPNLNYFRKPFSASHKSYSAFLKAAKLADGLRVTYKLYIEVQFYWFHQWRIEAPQAWQLGGTDKFPMKERIRKYLETGLSAAEKTDRVYTPRQKTIVKVGDEELIKYNKKLMADIMSDGTTEEEALIENTQWFNSVFLKRNRTFIRLVMLGKIEKPEWMAKAKRA